MKTRANELIWIVFAALAVFQSCETDTCFRGRGEPGSMKVETAEYDTMVIAGMFRVVLIEDTLSFVEFRGGENELLQVSADVRDSCLWLEQDRACTMLPGYGRTEAVVHTRHVRGVHVMEACSVESPDSLSTIRWIAVRAEIAELDIRLNTFSFVLYNHTTSGGIYKVSGYADRCLLNINYAVQCDFTQLRARDFIADNGCLSDFYINAEEKLKVRIYSSGDIYYSGSPEITIDTIAGTGRLLPWVR